ncbi:MAG: hypothetical protein PHY72_03175 [Candidatus Pacebacteria bacterium]|nr:hypothetical protein [Candidatus Paceibacterota bacterium]
MQNTPYVINSRGEQEPFSVQKVERSARRVGASLKLAKEIAKEVERKIYNGIPTFEVFKEVKNLLNQAQPIFGLKFNLKQAMRGLGPDGFGFEKYVAALLRGVGFKVKLNQFISGKCLSQYEIDFVAEGGNILKIGECKYHSQAGIAVDQEVALANHARFLDITQGKFALSKIQQGKKVSGLLVTNTRFSTRAIKYSECSGDELWGWKYPNGNGLEVFIDKNKFYPLNILPSFQKQWTSAFNSRNIILAGDILKINLQRLSQEENIPQEILNKMAEEAKTLFGE